VIGFSVRASRLVSGEDEQQRQQDRPAEDGAARAQDDERADEAACHQRPAQPGDLFLQRGGGEQGDDERSDQDDRGELGERHVAQAQERERARRQQQGAAQQLKARVLGSQHRRAVARQQHQRGRHGLERIAEPQAHQDRHADGRHLGGRVEGGEAGDGDDDQADAGEDAFGFEIAPARHAPTIAFPARRRRPAAFLQTSRWRVHPSP